LVLLDCRATQDCRIYTDVNFTGEANDVTAALNESKCDLYSVFSFRYRINPTIKHQQNKLRSSIPNVPATQLQAAAVGV
jgi:hypothetical protein